MSEPSLELTEARVQERWMGLRQVAETLIDRIAKSGEFDFATGTSYAGDDARLNPYLLSTAFHNCLAASIDHLHAATVLVVDVQVLHMSAGASLARGLLENAAAAFWMLKPQSRPERLSRTLRWWAKNANDQRTGTSGLPESARGRPKGEILAKLTEVAKRNGVEGSVIGGYTSTAALTYADDVAVSKDGSRIGPLLPWRLCSGFAHGRPWASLGSLEREEFPTSDPSISYMRLTNSLSGALYPVLIGTQLLEAVLREHRLRGTRAPV